MSGGLVSRRQFIGAALLAQLVSWLWPVRAGSVRAESARAESVRSGPGVTDQTELKVGEDVREKIINEATTTIYKYDSESLRLIGVIHGAPCVTPVDDEVTGETTVSE